MGELPLQIWTQLVQLFLRLLDTDKQTEHTSKETK